MAKVVSYSSGNDSRPDCARGIGEYFLGISGGSWIPGVDEFANAWVEIIKTAVSGICAVYFPVVAAPSGRQVVAIVVATVITVVMSGLILNAVFFTNYYDGVPIHTVLWESAHFVLGIACAIITAAVVWKQSYAEVIDPTKSTTNSLDGTL